MVPQPRNITPLGPSKREPSRAQISTRFGLVWFGTLGDAAPVAHCRYEINVFGLVWFGLGLEPQLRAQKRASLAEDALAHNASLGLCGISENSRPDPGATCAAERRLVTSRRYSGP
jgi:hypothetical protein